MEVCALGYCDLCLICNADVFDFDSDHSCSKKSSNNHRLPPACSRCKRLFVDEVAAQEHGKELRSDPPCPILRDEDLSEKNHLLERDGISDARRDEVDDVLYRVSRGETPIYCDEDWFQKWVHDNTDVYIGESGITKEEAELELKKWLLVFVTLFPGEEIPEDPCEYNYSVTSPFTH